MSILPDSEIIKLSENGMISPFVHNQVKSAQRQDNENSEPEKIISFGTSSYGYDKVRR